MTTRIRSALIILAAITAASFAWRLWSERGLVTIDASGAPLAGVLRSIEKQTGIVLATDAPTHATVTMHVIRVPLVRALRVLATAMDAHWSVAYLVAPGAAAIRAELANFTDGRKSDWKRFVFRAPPFPGMAGSSDPREDRWKPASAENLHAYLEQASRFVEAEFWVPGDFDPPIATSLPFARVESVVRDLARAASGTSERVFLLNTQGDQEFATAGPTESSSPSAPAPPAQGEPPGGGPPDETMRAAIEARLRSQIDQLPQEQRAAAVAEFEGRKAFFDELAALPAVERSERMQERMEQDMEQNAGKMEANMTQMDASQTVEQRTEFFRRVLQDKAAKR